MLSNSGERWLISITDMPEPRQSSSSSRMRSSTESGSALGPALKLWTRWSVAEVAANEFGVGFVELRGLWNKNIVNLEAKDVAEAQNLLKKHDLKVTDIASPLFKVDWPGAPKSKYSPKGTSYGASFSFDQQDEVLERAANMAHAFSTNRIRLFD